MATDGRSVVPPLTPARSAPPERDALEEGRDALACVDRSLERLEDVLPADDDHWVDAVCEQGGDRLAADAVSLVLQPVDLDEMARQIGAVAESVQRGGHFLAGCHEDGGERHRL